jgi:acetylornithine/succinyldiaminopimelate/putrescine aminotransferase
LMGKALDSGEYLTGKLESLRTKHPSIVREVRGKGLMIAVELKIPVKDVIMKGFEYNLILLYSGLNILRFLPPLVITKEQMDRVVQSLDQIFLGIERKGGSSLKAVEEVAS